MEARTSSEQPYDDADEDAQVERATLLANQTANAELLSSQARQSSRESTLQPSPPDEEAGSAGTIWYDVVTPEVADLQAVLVSVNRYTLVDGT